MATVVIPQHVLSVLVPLGAGCVGVYVAAAAEADKEGFAEVSQVSLAATLGLKRETVGVYLQRLAYAGLVELIRTPGRPTVVRFPEPNLSLKRTGTCRSNGQVPVAISDTHLSLFRTPTCRSNGHQPVAISDRLDENEAETPDLSPKRTGTCRPNGQVADGPSRARVVSLSNSTELVVDNGKKGITENTLESCRETAKIDDLTDSAISPVSEPAAKAQKRILMTPDWTLPEEWLTWAVDLFEPHNLHPSRAVILGWADHFREYWVISKKRRPGWELSWHNWVRKELTAALQRVEREKHRRMQAALPPPDESAGVVRQRRAAAEAARIRAEAKHELLARFRSMGAAEQVAQFEALSDRAKLDVKPVLHDEAAAEIGRRNKEALRRGLAGGLAAVSGGAA